MASSAPNQSPQPRKSTPMLNTKSREASIKRERSDIHQSPGSDGNENLSQLTGMSSNFVERPQISPENNVNSRQNSSNNAIVSRNSSTYSPAPAQVPEPDFPTSSMSQQPAYDTSLGTSALPIQQSIEDEQNSSAEEQTSTDSKQSSSQQSVENERIVPQIDGHVLPTHPILGTDEYALALPAEGKIQSIYMDTIKSKRKPLLKFIHRHESVGSSSGSTNRTIERNEMIELIQRLNNTTTHLDLGLPGFSNQYSVRSEEQATYANYASAKFAFLGHLVDVLKYTDCCIAVFARSGPIQTLLEEYLLMKEIYVRRAERSTPSTPTTARRLASSFKVDLWSTNSPNAIDFIDKPVLIIAFDTSFDAQEPILKHLRERHSSGYGRLVPIIHLLVANSSEHIDRCLPKNMPSPQRLRLHVRATYQARTNLGGSPTFVPKDSDEPEGRPMDLSDLQRAVRKSPDRKLILLASLAARAALSQDFASHWNLGEMPELQLEELDESPPKSSKVTTATGTPKDGIIRSRTPISRADTPSGRKRLLDIDGLHPALAKRQRLTPLQDTMQESENGKEQAAQIEQLKLDLKTARNELAVEKETRKSVEETRDYVQKRLDEWTASLADLQRRYEKRMTKCHELDSKNKALLLTIENNKIRQERGINENTTLKTQILQLEKDLAAARSELKDGSGDLSALEQAREEARSLAGRNATLERSLETSKKDFEFTRSQYQEASTKAADFAIQVNSLHEQIVELTAKASTERYRLKELNYHETIKRHQSKISELEQEKKNMSLLLKKMEDDIKILKKGSGRAGVQTRGSSVQPGGSPGPRSRQGSPAAGGLLVPPPHAGNRASVLRHER